MGRRPIFKKPMTHAQYKRRYRAKLKRTQREIRKGAELRPLTREPAAATEDSKS
jgi:hypothetical protein